MKIRIVYSFLLCLLLNCYPETAYWRRIPQPIESSPENYIRIVLPQELSDGGERKKIETYWLWVWEEELGDWMDRFVLITPTRKHSFSTSDGIEQAKFNSGCELQFLASGGKKRYEVKIGEFPFGLQVHELREVDLKPSQSLRIELVYVGKPFPDANTWVEEKENLKNQSLRLKFSVEDSSLPNQIELCKF